MIATFPFLVTIEQEDAGEFELIMRWDDDHEERMLTPHLMVAWGRAVQHLRPEWHAIGYAA